MDNKQAIEWLEYIKNGYSWSANCDKAVDIAIASLEAWNKVIEDLENLSENMTDGVGGSKFTVNFIIKMIKEYMEEIEE